jgi:hypothetical protein
MDQIILKDQSSQSFMYLSQSLSSKSIESLLKAIEYRMIIALRYVPDLIHLFSLKNL